MSELQKQAEKWRYQCIKLKYENEQLKAQVDDLAEHAADLEDYIHEIRPRADCYNRICRSLGIERKEET